MEVIILPLRRVFPRKVVQIPVVLKIENKSNRKKLKLAEKAFIINLGLGGVFIVSNPALPQKELNGLLEKRSRLHLEFFLPGETIAIITTGRIRWVEEKSKIFTNMTGIGVEFDDIIGEDLLEIAKYCFSEVSKKKGRKREFLRAATNIPINLNLFRRESALVNISPGGACLRVLPALGSGSLDSFFKKELKMKLKIYEKVISLTGKVKWVKSLKDKNLGKVSYLGIEFIDIDSWDRKYIMKFILKKKETIASSL